MLAPNCSFGVVMRDASPVAACSPIERASDHSERHDEPRVLRSSPRAHDEDRYVERQRHSRPAGRAAGLHRARAARRPVPAGNQGGDRSAPGVAVRARRLLVLLARRQRLFRRRPSRAQGDLSRASRVSSSRVRLRASDRGRAAAAGDRGVDLRAERRQGLSGEDALPRGDGRVRRRISKRPRARSSCAAT